MNFLISVLPLMPLPKVSIAKFKSMVGMSYDVYAKLYDMASDKLRDFYLRY